MRCTRLAVVFLIAHGALLTQALPESTLPDEPVIRVTPSLVRIDAMVTDQSGKPVRGLTRGDFQILQDDNPQELTTFDAVNLPIPPVVPLSGPPTCHVPLRYGGWKGTEIESDPLALHNGLARNQVRRTLAIVVEKAGWVECEAIDKTVRERLTDVDLTAIVGMDGNNGIYQQFTNDRQLLAGAGLDWGNSPSRRTANGLPPRGAPVYIPDAAAGQRETQTITLASGPRPARPVQRAPEIKALRQIAVNPIADAVRALKDLPGRKALVLFASGYPVLLLGSQLDRLADQATRAGVTIYTIYTTPYSSQKFPPKSRPGSLSDFAQATGGIFYNQKNHVEQALNDALDDQSSYYLVGYKPDLGTFNGTFHRIQVRVKNRPELTVRSHTGFMGYPDAAAETEPEPSAAAPNPVADRMFRALLQPLQITDLHVRLTAAFQVKGDKPRVQNVLWIDGRDLTFKRDASQRSRTELEVLAECYDPDGIMSEHVDQLYQLNLDAGQLAEARRSGFTFSFACHTAMPTRWVTQAASVPIQTAHQMRVAVREVGTGKLGTASQYLSAPNLTANELALSGISIGGFGDIAGEIGKPVFGSAALGRRIQWSAQVFHARLSSNSPKLSVGVRVYRDGLLVQEKRLSPASALAAKNNQVDISDEFELSAAQPEGEYSLKVTVRDEKRGEQVSRWTVFEAAPPK
ncbi:MAG: VWA domain-containing protein [Acidobacteriota bacterium]